MNTSIDFDRRRRIATLSLFLIATTTALALADKPERSIAPPEFEENWYVVMIQDQPCGYMNSIMRTAGDQVRSDTITEIEIKRGTATVKMRMEQSSRELIDGTPISFRNVQTLGQVPQTVEGVIRDGRVHLTETQLGSKHESDHPFDPECRFAWGQMLASEKYGVAPGTRYTLKTYEPSLRKDGPVEMSFLVHGLEKTELLGQTRRLHHVTSSMKLDSPAIAALGTDGASIDSDVWMNDDLTPEVMTVNLGFMQMKMYRTTKEEALKRGAPPEMFLQTMVTADRDVSRDATTTKYRLSTTSNGKSERAKLPSLPSTNMQSFERIDDHTGIVTVHRIDWDALKKQPNGEIPESLKSYLKPSSVCDSADRKVRRIALRATTDDEPPTTRADQLRKFVTNYITSKGMDIGFATATEVAKNKAGDCTEHSVLLAAAARAAGIPSRGVGGLVGVPGSFRRNADGPMDFGFHMWTQVYIHGRWVDIDAAMRQTDCDTTHIAITLIPLGDEGLMSEVWSIVPLLGQLKIEVIDETK